MGQAPTMSSTERAAVVARIGVLLETNPDFKAIVRHLGKRVRKSARTDLANLAWKLRKEGLSKSSNEQIYSVFASLQKEGIGNLIAGNKKQPVFEWTYWILVKDTKDKYTFEVLLLKANHAKSIPIESIDNCSDQELIQELERRGWSVTLQLKKS